MAANHETIEGLQTLVRHYGVETLLAGRAGRIPIAY